MKKSQLQTSSTVIHQTFSLEYRTLSKIHEASKSSEISATSGSLRVLDLRFRESSLPWFLSRVKKQPNVTQLFPVKQLMKTFNCFFSQNKQASCRLLENTNIQCRWQTSYRGDLGMFLGLVSLRNFWISNKISISTTPWNSGSFPCDGNLGKSLGVRKESMKRKQKWSKSVTSPGWPLTFANKKVKTHHQTL